MVSTQTLVVQVESFHLDWTAHQLSSKTSWSAHTSAGHNSWYELRRNSYRGRAHSISYVLLGITLLAGSETTPVRISLMMFRYDCCYSFHYRALQTWCSYFQNIIMMLKNAELSAKSNGIANSRNMNQCNQTCATGLCHSIGSLLLSHTDHVTVGTTITTIFTPLRKGDTIAIFANVSWKTTFTVSALGACNGNVLQVRWYTQHSS